MAVIEINIPQFVLHGEIPPFSAQTGRTDLLQLLGPPDQPSYAAHVVYGNLCFDLAGGVGPLAAIQIGFPHDEHQHCRLPPEWAKDWKPPAWVDPWPDARFRWTLGPFLPGATLSDIQRAIPELEVLEWLEKYGGRGSSLIFRRTNVMIEFSFDQAVGTETLLWVLGPLKGPQDNKP